MVASTRKIHYFPGGGKEVEPALEDIERLLQTSHFQRMLSLGLPSYKNGGKLNRRYLPALFVAVFQLFPAQAQTVRDDSLYSPSLGRMKHLNILLPEGDEQERPHPMLILLHGFSGNYTNWIERTKLVTYVGALPLVVVMPDGENSWYVNQKTRPEERFEDYLMDDVFGFVTRTINIDTLKVAIGGLSMGGYGALVLGLRHPTRFSFIAALSGSLDIPNGIPDLEKNGRDGMRPWIVGALGDTSSSYWKEHDPFALAAGLDSASAPYIYLANGIQDAFKARLQLYREFADTLRQHSIPYEYHETPGRHDWEYWDEQIREVILGLADCWELQARRIQDR